MKVVVAVGDEQSVDELRTEFPNVEFQRGGSAGEQARDADVYYGRPTREIIQAAKRLRWVQNPGAGIDWIADVPELIDSDVVLTNTRGVHAGPLADHVFAMTLALAHRLPICGRTRRRTSGSVRSMTRPTSI